MKEARGIFIVPQLLKAAFYFGGEGGSGVFLVKDDKTGEWSDPDFYTNGSRQIRISIRRAGFGIRAAGDVAARRRVPADQHVHARRRHLSRRWSGRRAIATRDEWNRDYYGTEVRPTDILVKRAVTNPQSAGLRAALALARRGRPRPVRPPYLCPNSDRQDRTGL